MCQGLRALQQSMAAYAGGFDARTLTAAQAGEVVRLCAQIEASAASIKALAAARAAETKTWQHDGYRSAAEQLADQAGMSPAAAKRALETGRRLADQPEVAAAALAGDLSLEQATAVSDGVAADPAKAARTDRQGPTQLPARTQRRSGQDQSRPHRPRTTPPGPPRQTIPAALDRPRRRLPRPPLRPPRRRRHACGACSTPSAAASTSSAASPAPPTSPSTPSTTTPSWPWPPSPPAPNTELALADLIELGLFPQLDPPTPTDAADRPTADAASRRRRRARPVLHHRPAADAADADTDADHRHADPAPEPPTPPTDADLAADADRRPYRRRRRSGAAARRNWPAAPSGS